MVKTFKRIAALAMAIALVVCFAVSASAAVNVVTTTTYTQDSENQKVDVSVSVSGDEIDSNDEVTYYATNGTTTVYIDQTTANGSGVAEFKFQTDATNLKSAVKVGYTGGTSAEDSNIEANTITAANAPDFIPVNIPTEKKETTVTVPYAAAAGMTVDTVEADGATVGTTSYENGNITVPLTNITGDVTLTVKEKPIPADTSVATMLDAGIVFDGDARKITVLGAASSTDEYGIIITTDVIDPTKTYTVAEMDALKAEYKAFEGTTNGTKGVFAVQVIDEATELEEQLITATGLYNVAVYVKMSNSDNYKVAETTNSLTLVQE